jgi:hypothetical protein
VCYFAKQDNGVFLMDIPECRIWISFKEDAANKEAT